VFVEGLFGVDGSLGAKVLGELGFDFPPSQESVVDEVTTTDTPLLSHDKHVIGEVLAD